MARLVHILVSVVSLAAIVWGAQYSYQREVLRRTDLHALYQDIDRQDFQGSLPDIPVRWGSLDARGRIYFGDDLYIDVDRATNTGREMVVETLRHEACHAATVDASEDAHGPAFQQCMQRFK